MNKIYIYGIIDPDTKEIRYIGLTSLTPAIRLIQHLNSASEDGGGKSAWLYGLVSAGKLPELVVLQTVGDEISATLAEKWWIVHAQTVGWSLLNEVHRVKRVRHNFEQFAVPRQAIQDAQPTELQSLVWLWRDTHPEGTQAQMRSDFVKDGIEITRSYAHELWHKYEARENA